MTLSPLAYIIGGLWLVSALFDYAYFAYYAQLKEYRLDRFRDFILSPAGKEFLFGVRILWRAVFVLVLFTLLRGTIANIYLIGVVIGVDILLKGYGVYTKNVRRPVTTGKSVLIVAGLVGFEFLALIFAPYINVLFLIFVCRWLLVALVVVCLAVPSTLIKQLYIRLATKKIAAKRDLIVVGITGSYGKSSTKEFLSQILSTKFSVIKTPKNTNTEIGVAKFILATDFTDVDVFVVEMGAYRIGEIKMICDIVKPKIGILTAIAPQHLSLFGSMENIRKAKSELLHALPPDGLAITNSDNDYCRSIIPELTCRVRTFGSDEDFAPNVRITDIETISDGISFTIASDFLHNHQIRVPILGKHNAFNIVPAGMTAVELGMNVDDITHAAEHLAPGHGSLKVFMYGKATVINDSYNSNPEGFKAALDVMNTYGSSKRRIVITRGMLELAGKSSELHEQIGGEISFVADELIITEKTFADYISRGVVSKFNTDVHRIFDPAELVHYVQSLKETDCVILIENKIHAMLREEFGI